MGIIPAVATWFQHITGNDDGSGAWYLWWSGFFGDLTIFAAVAFFYWRHTCHVGRCLRPGLHKVEGTPYTTCKTHHPLIDHTVRVTSAAIQSAHEEANRGIDSFGVSNGSDNVDADAGSDSP